MAAKFILVLCASALLVQSIAAYSNCGCGQSSASRAGAIAAAEVAAANNLGYGKSSCGCTSPAVASANGGALSVSFNSPYGPYGINIVSENTIEGVLEVLGSLPVLATVNLDGTVPSTGAAGASYSCGNGNVGISSESLAAAGFGAGNAFANGVTRAEIAGAQLANSAGYGAALAGAELAAANAGFSAYPQARYGAAGLNAAVAGAELAAGARIAASAPGCGCNY